MKRGQELLWWFLSMGFHSWFGAGPPGADREHSIMWVGRILVNIPPFYGEYLHRG